MGRKYLWVKINNNKKKMMKEMTRKGVNRTTTMVEKGREAISYYLLHPSTSRSLLTPKWVRRSLAIKEDVLLQ